jgi:hypothetical protein
MKENNFYSDDFEELIRGKTEQYKMYPSENVWKGVHSALHTKRKWFIGSMTFLVTGILFMAGRELILPSKPIAVNHKAAAATGAIADGTRPTTTEITTPTPLAALRPANTPAGTRHNAAGNGTTPEEWDPAIAGISITVSHPVLSQSDLSEWLSHVVRLPAQAPDLDVIAARAPVTDNNAGATSAVSLRTTNDEQRNAGDGLRIAGDEQRTTADDAETDGLSAHNVLESLSAHGTNEGRYSRTGTSLETSRGSRNVVRGKDRLAESAGAATKASATEIAESEDAQRVNWLHDYAMNILDATPKTGRTYFQFSLSPTVSYRTLGGSDPSAEHIYYPSAGAYAVPGSPNTYADHRPAFGFGASGSILYRLTRNLSVKGGLQFNFTRSPIKAFSSDGSTSTTPLSSPYGNLMDSLYAASLPTATTRNSSRSAVTVDNDYYQLSAPIGFELRVLGNERLQFNLAATIAPSYLLNSSSYMLTTAYTKYEQQPDRYRKLNFYAGAEAFLSYRVGSIRWQIGPEFRYQLLSSYNSSWPVTENLKSYGLKFGITKALP